MNIPLKSRNLLFGLLLTLLFPAVSFAQNLNGQVFEKGSNAVLPGASVVWSGTTSGTMTDTKGAFTLPFSTQTNKLIVSYVGYKADTLTITPKELFLRIYLKQSGSLSEVEITAKKDRFCSRSSCFNCIG